MKRIFSQILTLAVIFTAVSCEELSVNEVASNAPVIASFTPQSAPVGAEIIVTGEYLHNVSAAYIGDVQVDIVQKVSNTRLTVAVGQEVTSGKIILVNESGRGTSDVTFTCSYAVPEISANLLQAEAEMGTDMLISGKWMNSVKSVIFTAEGYETGHVAEIKNRNDEEIVVRVPYVEQSSARITMTYYDGASEVATPLESAPAINIIRYVPQIDSYQFTRTAVGKSIVLTGSYLNNIDKVFVGEFEAPVFKEPSKLTFTIPAGNFEDGETEVVLKALYFDCNETIVLKNDFIVYVPFVKYWENVKTYCQGRFAESAFVSFFSPETGIAYENAKWKTDLDPIALKYSNSQWVSGNLPKPGVVSDEEYDSVVPYFFFSSVSGNVLQLNSPANSNSQLKNFYIDATGTPSNDYRVPGGNTTLPGTPILTFRYLDPANVAENELREKVIKGEIENINEELFPINLADNTVAGIGMTSAKGGTKSSDWCTRHTNLVDEPGYKADAVFIVAYYSNCGYSKEAPVANIKRLGFLHVTTIDWVVATANNDYRNSSVNFNCYWQKYDYDYTKLQ